MEVVGKSRGEPPLRESGRNAEIHRNDAGRGDSGSENIRLCGSLTTGARRDGSRGGSRGAARKRTGCGEVRGWPAGCGSRGGAGRAAGKAGSERRLGCRQRPPRRGLRAAKKTAGIEGGGIGAFAGCGGSAYSRRIRRAPGAGSKLPAGGAAGYAATQARGSEKARRQASPARDCARAGHSWGIARRPAREGRLLAAGTVRKYSPTPAARDSGGASRGWGTGISEGKGPRGAPAEGRRRAPARGHRGGRGAGAPARQSPQRAERGRRRQAPRQAARTRSSGRREAACLGGARVWAPAPSPGGRRGVFAGRPRRGGLPVICGSANNLHRRDARPGCRGGSC